MIADKRRVRTWHDFLRVFYFGLVLLFPTHTEQHRKPCNLSDSISNTISNNTTNRHNYNVHTCN